MTVEMISRGINFNLKAIFKKGAMGIILLMFFMSSVAYADNATILPEANINTKIGRASCRERVS